MSNKEDLKINLTTHSIKQDVIIKFYASGSDVHSNMSCVLLLKASGIKFEVLPSSAMNLPIYPAISVDSIFILGSSNIARYICYQHLKQPQHPVIDDVLDILEYQLLNEMKGLHLNQTTVIHFESKIYALKDILNKLLLQFYLYPVIKTLSDKNWLLNPDAFSSILSEVESSTIKIDSIHLLESIATVDLSDLDWSAMGLLSSLRFIFTTAITQAFQGINGEGFTEAIVVRCSNSTFGDFQCNNAMSISKTLKASGTYKGSITPKDMADRICKSIPQNHIIDSVNIAPNGFINIKLSISTLTQTIARIVQNGVTPPSIKKLNVLVDFSSPNIAKEMHVGHLRSTIIGDSLCRILEFCGHDVMRVNHVGDWGTQFGMLITYLREEYPNILTNPPNISDLTAIYKESKKRFDTDEDFKEKSRLNVVNLQSGDEGCRQIWTLLCDISRREFQRVYDALGVHLKEIGESFYNPMIPDTIQKLRNLGMLYEEGGMLLVKLEHFTIPLILRKSDGGYGYDSTDMAAIYYRLFELKRDWIIIITDAGQSPHFQMIFDAAKAAGWITTQRVDHIGFGVVQGEDGKRFKTRSSETVRLIDLLDAAKERMKESFIQRAQEGKSNLAEEELTIAAQVVGYGAVKYFDLKQHPTTNYIFSYDRMLDTRGDTAVYLLFAYARLVSILRKAQEERGVNIQALSENVDQILTLDHPAERVLGFELLMLNDVIKTVLADLLPNKLCDYLKDLSVKFTDFVTKCHVLNAAEMNSRLLICEATRKVLSKCFELLGINTLDRI